MWNDICKMIVSEKKLSCVLRSSVMKTNGNQSKYIKKARMHQKNRLHISGYECMHSMRNFNHSNYLMLTLSFRK